MCGWRVVVWVVAWGLVWCGRGVAGDEEDPLQHEAQVAARDRQLTQVLHTIGVERFPDEDGDARGEEVAKTDQIGAPCNHDTLDFSVQAKHLKTFRDGMNAALHLANLLNNLFVVTPDGRDTRYPRHVFYALMRAAMENEPSVTSAGVAFLRGKFLAPLDPKAMEDEEDKEGTLRYLQGTEGRDMFGAYVFRREGNVGTAELSTLYNHTLDLGTTDGTDWFTHFSYRSSSRYKPRPLNTSTDPLASPHGSPPPGSRPSLALTREEDGHWSLRPFLDCGASGAWVVAYSLPFFEREPDTNGASLKGVVVVTVPLERVDINQCDDTDLPLDHYIFRGTHKCDDATTKCVPVSGFGFRRGGYKCQCRPTHHLPNHTHHHFPGQDVELAYARNRSITTFRCAPCPEGCGECSGGVVCGVRYDATTRVVPVCVEAACVFCCLVLGFVVFKLRKCKVIAASLWTMLEMVLLGAIVLYSTIFLRYVEPTVLLCMVEPWFREMGFALFYGAIVLKLYRSLVDYRTRKAHRYVIRDRDLLKYLAGLVVFVTGYLAAWSALTAHLATEGHSPLALGRTPQGLTFQVCKSVWWEYVTEAGELLFILFGLYLAWHLTKAAKDSMDPSELLERRALAISLLLELTSSAALYTARHLVWLHAHPDHVFLAYFARTHITVTISLLFILTPKLWCAGGSRGRGDLLPRTYSATEGPEPRYGDALTNGDLEVSDINLSQMDPEEIRAELKRVYTQLEVLRTKTMRKDNPHISKRRGGRKATHRKFSIQSRKGSREKSMHRHQPRPLPTLEGGEGEISKTPEESVCSIEGPSVLSVYADGPSEVGTPSILHRSYKL